MKERMKAVLFPIGKRPRVVEFDYSEATGWKDLARAIGADMIEMPYDIPSASPGITCTVVIDEEGKINGSDPNRAVYFNQDYSAEDAFAIRDPTSATETPADIIFGNFMVIGTEDRSGKSVSIPDEDIARVGKLFNVHVKVDEAIDPSSNRTSRRASLAYIEPPDLAPGILRREVRIIDARIVFQESYNTLPWYKEDTHFASVDSLHEALVKQEQAVDLLRAEITDEDRAQESDRYFDSLGYVKTRVEVEYIVEGCAPELWTGRYDIGDGMQFLTLRSDLASFLECEEYAIGVDDALSSPTERFADDEPISPSLLREEAQSAAGIGSGTPTARSATPRP